MSRTGTEAMDQSNNRFARAYRKLRSRLGGRRKLALAIVGLWIAAELLAAAAVAVAGTEWLESGSEASAADRSGTPAFGSRVSHSTPSIAVF
jgi:hypothetical protein